MDEHRAYISRLVEQGGPTEAEYEEFTGWLGHINGLVKMGVISQEELGQLRHCFGAALSPSTIQGFAFHKPHGYAGDYEIIERFYQGYISPDPKLANWDHYSHNQPAVRAVRNRKTYFKELVDRHYARACPLSVLDIASGSGRSIFEWLCANPNAAAQIDCIEIDAGAIQYAKALNRPFLDRVTFTQKNALIYRPNKKYDLIWAAGIFDYFTDSVFTRLLKRFVAAVAPGGELVIGNFSDKNPSWPYLELMGDWELQHRGTAKLRALGCEAGIAEERMHIGMEAEGVNLFMHISADSHCQENNLRLISKSPQELEEANQGHLGSTRGS